MEKVRNLIRIGIIIAAMVFITIVSSGQTTAKTGVLTASATNSGVQPNPKEQTSQPHSVTLSWTASVPKSTMPDDAIIGYNVYRSTAPTPVTRAKASEITCKFVSATSCVDKNVVTGQTYNYAVTALTRNRPNDESELSKPITVTIH